MIILAAWTALFGVWPLAHPDCGVLGLDDPVRIADQFTHVTGAGFCWLWWRVRFHQPT